MGVYRHWRVEVEAPVATVTMQVQELKLNSYDLEVDVELADVVQRLRFEHPAVHVVVLTGGLDRVFCAGANIQMLAGATHAHKVNFCKFTNETRFAIEDASAHSGQRWIAAVNGTAAGGGYELALACAEIVLVDDRSSTVSLPEVPLLAVLPGTGGLTRLVDKRHVRRDLADAFATKAEGIRGAQAVEWGLVDGLARPSEFDQAVRERALALAAESDRPRDGPGIVLPPVEQPYRWVSVAADRSLRAAHVTVRGPSGSQPASGDELVAADASSWVLAAARELDDALLRLRFDEPELGTWVLHTSGDVDAVLDAEAVLSDDHWLAREVRLLWAQVLRRLDVSARTLVALVEPGSCFAGVLAELALAADRTLMLASDDDEEPAVLHLAEANDGWFPGHNGLSRLATRFWGRDDALAAARAQLGKDLLAADAAAAGLVTFTPDDLDWDDEVRLTLEERAGFSPDALTGMEANLRFAGPETMETKVLGRLSAWQNWVFQRPNAVGPEGALRRFGTGARPTFDRGRT